MEISREMNSQNLKLHPRKSWPKFEQVTKKEPTSVVGTVSFRWKIHFWYLCSLLVNIEKLCLFFLKIKEGKKSKVGFSSKANGSNVRDFLITKNTVRIKVHTKGG